MTALVLDVSVAIAWCARSQATHLTDRAEAYVNSNGAMLPAHFQLELSNALWRFERTKKLTRQAIDIYLQTLMGYALEYDAEAVEKTFADILPLARKHGLSSYDAGYLELAARLQLPLATRDAALARAANSVGVQLFVP